MGCAQSSLKVANNPTPKPATDSGASQMEVREATGKQQSIVIFPTIYLPSMKASKTYHQISNVTKLSVVKLQSKWFSLNNLKGGSRPQSNTFQHNTVTEKFVLGGLPLETPESSLLGSRQNLNISHENDSVKQWERQQRGSHNLDSDISPINELAEEDRSPGGFIGVAERMREEKSPTVPKLSSDNKPPSEIRAPMNTSKAEYTIKINQDKAKGLDRSQVSFNTSEHQQSFDHKEIHSPAPVDSCYKRGRTGSIREGGFGEKADVNRSGCFEDMQEYIERTKKFGKQIMKSKYWTGNNRTGSLNIIEDLKRSPKQKPKDQSSFVIKDSSKSIPRLRSQQSNQEKDLDPLVSIHSKDRGSPKPSPSKFMPAFSPFRSHSQEEKAAGELEKKQSLATIKNRDLVTSIPGNSGPHHKSRLPLASFSPTIKPLKKMRSSDCNGEDNPSSIMIKRVQTLEGPHFGFNEPNTDLKLANSGSTVPKLMRRGSMRVQMGQGKDIIKLVKRSKASPSPLE